MADVHSKKTRSYNMSQIKGKHTKPEILVRKHLFANGFRYRLHYKSLPGTPDIVLPKYKSVILIHGCFWHGHENCKYYIVPGTNTSIWVKKISRNKEIDVLTKKELLKLGWKVIEIWECDLKPKKIENTVSELITRLIKNEAN